MITSAMVRLCLPLSTGTPLRFKRWNFPAYCILIFWPIEVRLPWMSLVATMDSYWT